MKLLDLFCGAGGCAMGYHRAGFTDIVGVDIKRQPRYPFTFVKAGALEFLKCLKEADEIGDALGALNATGGLYLSDFDAIHASPPCQGYSRMRHLPWLKNREYSMLIPQTLNALEASGKPWVLENVEDAREILSGQYYGVLCGKMFGLKVYRHRLFATNTFILFPRHTKHTEVIGSGRMLNDRAKPNASGMVCFPGKGTLNRNYHSDGVITVGGHNFKKSAAEAAMDIDWMTRDELAQAIPPAYTEYIGRQLIAAASQP